GSYLWLRGKVFLALRQEDMSVLETWTRNIRSVNCAARAPSNGDQHGPPDGGRGRAIATKSINMALLTEGPLTNHRLRQAMCLSTRRTLITHVDEWDKMRFSPVPY